MTAEESGRSKAKERVIVRLGARRQAAGLDCSSCDSSLRMPEPGRTQVVHSMYEVKDTVSRDCRILIGYFGVLIVGEVSSRGEYKLSVTLTING